MNFYPNDPSPRGLDALDAAAEGLADSVLKGLSNELSEVLADPIVQALMAADGVDPACIETLLRRVASAKLSNPELCAARTC
jgi:hypothetical protein